MADVNTPELDKRGIYLFFGEVNTDSCNNLVRFILEKNSTVYSNKELKCIQIFINSPGGSLDSAFSVCDIISGSRLPVYTVGVGQVASAALVIFMTGVKGKRILTPNTSILSHQWTWLIISWFYQVV